jgi:phosphoribosylanthranilate isomerase
MKVKICGITTPEDAVAAADAGADAIGLNFVAGPRRIDPLAAEAILDALPPLVVPVALIEIAPTEAGLFNEQVAELLATRWISTVQLYGEVTAETVHQLAWQGYRPLVPVHVRDASFAAPRPDVLGPPAAREVAGVLLDAYDPDKQGGTGRAFHWEWVRQARARGELAGWPPVVLAGGLTPDNVAEAVRRTTPYAVDVASGVESAPGRKDKDQVRRFIAEARRAAQEMHS